MVNIRRAGSVLLVGLLFVFATVSPIAIAQSAPPTTPPSSPYLVIDPASLSNSQSLNVGAGTTAVIDFSNSPTLTLTGDLSNAGTIYAVSSNPQNHTVTFNANNIFNQQGGLFTTILPSGGIPGFSNLFGSLSLTLNAVNNVTNYGTISSASNLSVIAGNTITNGSATATAATMQAVNNLNLQANQIVNSGALMSQLANITATANSVINSGTIQALMGNLTVQSLTNTLAVNNTAGSLLAGKDLTFQTISKILNADNTPGAKLDVLGGVLGGTNVIFNSDKGAITVNVDRLDGAMQAAGATGAVSVANGQLNIASLNFTGDPTFYNSGGSVTLGSNTSVIGDLAIVASQDIVVQSLASSPGGGQNGNMTLIAGANFTAPPVVNTQVGPDTTTTITINGGSVTGGSVQVNGGITTAGGNLVVAAYSGSGAGSAFAPGSINITGATDTARGNVTMLAGATSGVGIQAGNITSSGPSSNAGAITLITAAPIIGGAGTISITNGVMTGSFNTAGLTATNASIRVGNVLSAGAGGGGGGNATSTQAGFNAGAVKLQAGTGISTNWIRAFGGGGGAGFYSAGGKGGNGNTVSLSSTTGLISINGDVNTSGGGGGASGAGNSGGTGGDAAAIAITSGGAISIAGPILAAGGGAGGAGSIGGAGGGGSFGGGGGGGESYFGVGGGGAGGGFTGGGGGGGGANVFDGGGGGGGGFDGGGGGGGGAGNFSPTNTSGAGGGGGGIGVGGGGGGGGTNGGASGGGAGGAGGFSGGSSQSDGSSGGAGAGGGGSGGSGVATPGGGGGFGGAGGASGTGTGAGGSNPFYPNAGSGGKFGVGGTASASSTATGGTNVGTSGKGANVTITGVGAVSLSGTIGGLGTATGSTNAFSGLPYSGESIMTVGTTPGNINVSVTSPSPIPIYFADANYGAGASTYAVTSLGGMSTAGAFTTNGAGTITLNGTTLGTQTVSAATVNTTYAGPPITIVEKFGATNNNVVITNGSLVTPAEFIAALQVAAGGQTLIISQNASTTSPGTGYASGGSFGVATTNIPAGNFTSLVLPTGVTENASVGSLTYNGTARVDGIINFTSSPSTLTANGTISGGGQINGTELRLVSNTGNIHGPVSANPLMVDASILSVSAPTAGSIARVNVTTQPNVTLKASNADTIAVALMALNGNLALGGDLNSSATPGSTIRLDAFSISESAPTRLFANTVRLTTTGGSIGAGSPIKTAASTLIVSTNNTGDVSVSNSGSVLVDATAGVGSLNLDQTANGAIITVAGIIAYNGNGITLRNIGSNDSIELKGTTALTTNGIISMNATGSGTISDTGAAASPIAGNAGSPITVRLTTGGGDIGTSSKPLTLGADKVELNTGGAGNVYLDDFRNSLVSTGANQVKDLVFTQTNPNGRLSVDTPGISATGNVTLQAGAGTNTQINLEGNVNAQIISLITNGTGTITESALGLGSGTLTAQAVNLTSDGGAVGTLANRILTSTAALTFNASNNMYDAAVTDSGTGSIRIITDGSSGQLNSLDFQETSANKTIILGNFGAGKQIFGAQLVKVVATAGADIDVAGKVETAGNSGYTIYLDAGSGSITRSVVPLGAGMIVGNTVVLKGASIGTSVQPLQLSVGAVGGYLAAQATTGSVYVTTPLSFLRLGNNATYGVNNSANADYVAQSAALIQITGPVTANGTIALTAAGAISNLTASTLTAPTIAMKGTSIGTSAQEVLTAATNVTANATTGSAFISNAGTVGTRTNLQNNATYGFTNTAAGTFSFKETVSDLDVKNTINVPTVFLSSAGSLVNELTGTITATNLTLKTSNGSIQGANAGTPFLADAQNLTASAGGGNAAWVRHVGAGMVSVVTDATTGTTNSAGTNWNLETTQGSVRLVNDITAGFVSSISSAADITNGGGVFTAPTILLSASGSTGIGAAGNPVLVDTPILRASAPNGSVYVQDNNTNQIELQSTQGALNTFSVTAPNGGLYVKNALSAQTVFLSSKTGLINDLAGTVTGNNVTLKTTNGIIIGNGFAQPFFVDAQNITVSAGAGSASWVRHVGTSTVSIKDDAVTGTTNSAGTNWNFETSQSSAIVVNNVVAGFNSSIDIAGDLTGGGTLSGPAWNVKASGPNGVGTFASPLSVNTPVLRASAPNGSVFIVNPNAGPISLRSPQGANNIYSIQTTNGSIEIFEDISAATVILRSRGNIDTTGGQLLAPTVVLGADGATGIGSAAPIFTTATQLTASTAASPAGAIYITDTATTSVTLTDNVLTGLTNMSAGRYTLLATNGGIIVQNDVTTLDPTGAQIDISATSTTAGNVTGPGVLSAVGLVNVVANGPVGIGTQGVPLNVTSKAIPLGGPVPPISGRVGFSAPNGDVNVNVIPGGISPSVAFNASSAGGNFNITGNGVTFAVINSISAGTFRSGFTPPAFPLLPIATTDIAKAGQISISGNFITVDNSTLTSRGGSLILAAQNFSIIQNGSTATAWGGDIIVSSMTSSAGITSSVTTSVALESSPITSGRTAVVSGYSAAQATTKLNNLTNQRSSMPLTMLTGTNTFTGNTVVFNNGGTLALNNASSVNGNYTITGGVVLLDSTTVGSAVLNGGSIRSTMLPVPPPPPVATNNVVNSTPPPNTNTNPTARNLFLSLLPTDLPNTNLNGTTVIPTDRTPVRQDAEHAAGPNSLQGGISTDANTDQPGGSAFFSGASFNSGTMSALQQNGVDAQPGSNPNMLTLNQGMMLFSPQSDIVVQIKEGTVFIPAGAVALVYETGNDSAIYTFVDDVAKPVRVQSLDKTFALHAGQQLVLTKDKTAAFDSINPCDDIGYRSLSQHDIGGGITAYLGEFSMASALANHAPCKALKNASDPQAKRTFDRMMKTAAAVFVVSGKKGAYKTRSN